MSRIKENIEKIKDRQFYSPNLKSFVIIEDEILKIAGEEIDLNKISSLEAAEKLMTLVEDLVYESKTKHTLDKETDHRGRVLLGKDCLGTKLWLTPPSWDCKWYWGFGYIHTPNSHSHFSGLVGKQEYYDNKKQAWLQSDYVHNPYDSPQLIETCFSYNEGWKIAELFKQFYLLREMAEFTGRDKPNCHITSDSGVDHGDLKDWCKKINEVMIPKITAEIMRILTHEKEIKVFEEVTK